MIGCENVFKSYLSGKTNVLKGVSLAVEEGSFTAILGASGSGKSTLLNVLSGLEPADKGRVFFGSEEISAMNEKQLSAFRRRAVGFIFQQYYLLPHLNVEGNVRMGADLAGNKDYGEILAAVGLKDKQKRKPFELSGGEQQRVCIARAISKRPEILFADEPTGALDEATGREVLDYILRLKREMGFTLIMVTHNANIAETAERIVCMKSGEIVSSRKNDAPKSAYEIGW